MMCTFIYLLFGLALTSMCINVVQEKLSATFQKAKLRIGATMGLDMTQMMEEELNQDNAMPSNNAASNGGPDKILKEEGVGDVLREKRKKKRKMSTLGNVNKNIVNDNPASKEPSEHSNELAPKQDDPQKREKGKHKSVEFQEA